MGNTSSKILFAVLIGVLIIASSRAGNAQEFRKELMKGIIQTIGPDVFKDMAKSVIKELAKDEEFRKQVMQQIIRDAVSAIGPENIKEMMKSDYRANRFASPQNPYGGCHSGYRC